METLGTVLFRMAVVMTALLGIWLMMGKRQIGELSPLDFIISITGGTIAGTAIVDFRVELVSIIMVILALGLLQIGISWLTLKNRKIQYQVNFKPTIMVENGKIIKENLSRVRLSVETLLQLLRGKDVFNINEVELAILEPQGKLSVLKKAEFLPLKPGQVHIEVASNQILTPVIIEGQLQSKALADMGFSQKESVELAKQYQDKLHKVFIAFMDNNHKLYVINDDVKETGAFLHII